MHLQAAESVYIIAYQGVDEGTGPSHACMRDWCTLFVIAYVSAVCECATHVRLFVCMRVRMY